MSIETPSALTSHAIHAALAAGDLLRRGFGTHFEIDSKEGKQNYVTQFDKAAEHSIISHLSHVFPNHAFLAEESGGVESFGSTVVWIIDPLDGTVNFARGIPHFSVSIAAAFQGQVISGVVYQPMLHELFVAEHGHGAYLNGKLLQVSQRKMLDESFAATGFPYNIDQNPLQAIDRFAEFVEQGLPIRRFGSAALDLAYLAAGRFDLYWEVGLHPWDMAAGKLLVEEAGGKISYWNGQFRPLLGYDNILATNGHLHEEMVRHLTKKEHWRAHETH
ncbi:MAG: inositol monophosphatase [Rhabdochlamydiaceae bacterium]|nr:inositol monophosphatase [Rhabdochlamydiaceae bacterium]